MERKYNKSLIGHAKALRHGMTTEERHLWYDFLRSYPIKFRRQAVISKYITDFYCPEAKLVVELDGSQHFEEKGMEKDEIRTKCLETYGLTVLRIPNNMVHEKFESVCEYIDNFIKQNRG